MSCGCFGCLLSKKKHPPQSQLDMDGLSSDKKIKLFPYTELKSATDNFHPSNKIGRGGFGTVYKGILINGEAVAVKVLSAESRQGLKEFLTEIDTITNVRHPNLVELIGCCVQGNNRILVYEYVENNSLDRALLGKIRDIYLNGPNSDTTKLNWSVRSAICLGTARGLAYLHEELKPHIVHRDIKASNVLLDQDYVPKIGDFGLAKLFPDNVTHISTRVAGTTGYLAPEYAMHGQLTKKADVYSFGVLALEIISGRSSSKTVWSEMGKYILEWTWQLYEQGRLKELVDPALEECPEDEVVRYMKVALFCTQAASVRRPSMSQVVAMLSKPIRLNEKELTPPGYMEGSSTRMSIGSKATYSSNLAFKDSSPIDSTPFTSNPVSYSEIVPR